MSKNHYTAISIVHTMPKGEKYWVCTRGDFSGKPRSINSPFCYVVAATLLTKKAHNICFVVNSEREGQVSHLRQSIFEHQNQYSLEPSQSKVVEKDQLVKDINFILFSLRRKCWANVLMTFIFVSPTQQWISPVRNRTNSLSYSPNNRSHFRCIRNLVWPWAPSTVADVRSFACI